MKPIGSISSLASRKFEHDASSSAYAYLKSNKDIREYPNHQTLNANAISHSS